MRLLKTVQTEELADPVRAKFAMVVPILEATLFSMNRKRAERLGGYEKMTLWDVAREGREGSGDAGICFEWAVHDAIASQHPLIHPLASEVLQDFCGIGGGSSSILFGPEKDGVIPILESVDESLTEDSRVYVGNRGQPPKLKRYIPQIVRAFRRAEARNKLPRSINGLWKADLFVGNKESEKWVGTTVKSNALHLEGAQGLRIGIYPRVTPNESPRFDDDLKLVRLPLPYDGGFMELFYKSFYLVRAFIAADARVPPPVSLPDGEDRFITQELEARREFAVLDVLNVLRDMSQKDLLDVEDVHSVAPSATLSEDEGLQDEPEDPGAEADFVSVTPEASTTE
ncbi:MAG: hypothetical protein M5U14_21015 [Acidimicrobiia bacterium]|nr:hypothetical protein [Acidimicrobiia bacterium]